MIYLGAAIATVFGYEQMRRGLIRYTNSNTGILKDQLKINENAIKHAQEILAKAPENQKRQQEEAYEDLVNNHFSKIHYGFNKEITTNEACQILKKLEPRLEFYKSLPNLLPFLPQR